MTDQSTDAAVRVTRNDNPLEIADPQEAIELYGELRSTCPVKHSSGAGGFYWLTRYEDVRAAALDSERFSSARKGVMLPAEAAGPRLGALEMDPPQHGPWRSLYMEGLTPAKIRAAEPRLGEIANRLIDKFASAGQCDLMKDYAEPYPVLGVCETIGLVGGSVERIRELSGQFADAENRPAMLQELGGLVLAQLLERRADPRDDYLTRVVNAEVEGRKMNEPELASFISGFLTAGHESTTSALGTLLAYVLSQPGLKERILADDEKAIAGSIEEAVRLYPPFQAFHRTTTEPVDVADVTIPADATVRLSWGAANRDPSVFEQPDVFDPDRSAKPHLGFGFGRHVCVGAALARLEMRLAVKELLRRLPDIRLADAKVEWNIAGGMVVRPNAFRATFTPKPQ